MRSPDDAVCARSNDRSTHSTPRIGPRRVLVGLWAALLTSACAPEKPPAPDRERPSIAASGADAAADEAAFDPSTGTFVLTYAADRGAFADTDQLADVPERARGLVKVHMLDGPRPPAGKVWVANLREKDEQGRHPLRTVAVDLFEELALGEGLSSEVELPDGLEVPPPPPKADKVIVYKTEWCGVCKKLLAYLDKKGVEYEAKDIEKDAAAAAELQAKAQAKGVKTGSVPVIDVEGELMVGFDRNRLEQLLAG